MNRSAVAGGLQKFTKWITIFYVTVDIIFFIEAALIHIYVPSLSFDIAGIRITASWMFYASIAALSTDPIAVAFSYMEYRGFGYLRKRWNTHAD